MVMSKTAAVIDCARAECFTVLDREVGGFAECGKAIDALRGEAPMLRFSGLF
jgi:hypothetical protein